MQQASHPKPATQAARHGRQTQLTSQTAPPEARAAPPPMTARRAGFSRRAVHNSDTRGRLGAGGHTASQSHHRLPVPHTHPARGACSALRRQSRSDSARAWRTLQGSARSGYRRHERVPGGRGAARDAAAAAAFVGTCNVAGQKASDAPLEPRAGRVPASSAPCARKARRQSAERGARRLAVQCWTGVPTVRGRGARRGARHSAGRRGCSSAAGEAKRTAHLQGRTGGKSAHRHSKPVREGLYAPGVRPGSAACLPRSRETTSEARAGASNPFRSALPPRRRARPHATAAKRRSGRAARRPARATAAAPPWSAARRKTQGRDATSEACE